MSILILALTCVSTNDGAPVNENNSVKLLPAFVLPVQIDKAQGESKKDDKGPPDKESALIRDQADQLATQGAKGVLALAEKVRGNSRPWKAAALASLLRLGPDAAPALDAIVQELNAKDSEFKIPCMEILAAIGPKAKSAIPAIIAASYETSDFDGSFRFGGSNNTAEAALSAVKAIDPDSLPRLAQTMLPSLMKVLESGREAPTHNALALLRELGPLAKSALPKLRDTVPKMEPGLLHEVFPVFFAAGEDGMAMLADYMLDAKTSSEIKVGLMRGCRWETNLTPSTIRIFRAMLKDKSPAVRVSALSPLEWMQVKELIPDMIPRLSDREILDVESDMIGNDSFHAARALGKQGEPAVPYLIKVLDDKTPLVRFQAAYSLVKIGKDAIKARPALETHLDDEVPLIQIMSATAILAQGKPHTAAMAKIAGHLRSDDKLLGDALWAVRDLKSAGRPLFPAIKKLALEAKELPVRRQSYEALRQIGGDSKGLVQTWVKLAQDDALFLNFPPLDEIRANVKEVQAAIPGLLKHLDSPDVNVRRRLMEVLTTLGPAAKDAMPALIKALEDDDFVASGAVEGLGAMGPEARPAVKALVKRYEDIKTREAAGKAREGDYDRRGIFAALEKIGPGAEDAIPMLLKHLSKQPGAARVLGKIGPAAKEAVPALEKMHQDGTTYEKTAAAFALLKITGKQEPYLLELTDALRTSKSAEVRFHIIELLGDLGASARPALPALLGILKDKTSAGEPFGKADLREPAAAALASFGPEGKAAVPDLIDMIQNSNHLAKVTAANTLAAIGPDAKAAIPALEKMALEHESYVPIVQNALAKIRGKQ